MLSPECFWISVDNSFWQFFFGAFDEKERKQYNELKRSENRDSPKKPLAGCQGRLRGSSPSLIVFPKHVLTCTTPNPQNAMGEQRQYLWGSETSTH